MNVIQLYEAAIASFERVISDRRDTKKYVDIKYGHEPNEESDELQREIESLELSKSRVEAQVRELLNEEEESL